MVTGPMFHILQSCIHCRCENWGEALNLSAKITNSQQNAEIASMQVTLRALTESSKFNRTSIAPPLVPLLLVAPQHVQPQQLV